jgi:hypothetical protein
LELEVIARLKQVALGICEKKANTKMSNMYWLLREYLGAALGFEKGSYDS